MKKLISILIFSLAIHGYSQILVSGQNEKDHDDEWSGLTAPLWSISSDDSAVKAWGRSSAKYSAWRELRNRQYRDEGMVFFNKYPDDPRFNEWFAKTCGMNRPQYWKDVMASAENDSAYLKKGTPLVYKIDTGAEKSWDVQYLYYRAKYLADDKLTGDQKNEFKRNELQIKLSRLSEGIGLSTGNLGAKFTESMPLVIHYIETVMDQHPEVLSEFLNIASHDRSLESVLINIMKLSKDSNVHNIALEQEALYNRLREKPVQLKLPVLGKPDKTIDLEKLRGKVVLIDAWNIHCGSCIAHMPKFERIYKQFNKLGFEMVALCVIGWDGRDKKEAEIAKALEIEKRMGVTYPSAELDLSYNPDGGMDTNNPVWNFFDGLVGGSYYLLDKEGKLVTIDGGGQWQEYEIRRLLGLPLENTGK